MNRRRFLQSLMGVPLIGAALVRSVEALVVRPYIRLTGQAYMTEWLEMPDAHFYVAYWYQWATFDGAAKMIRVPMIISHASLAKQSTVEQRIHLVACVIENGLNSLHDYIDELGADVPPATHNYDLTRLAVQTMPLVLRGPSA